MNWKRLTLLFAAIALVAVGGSMAISATYSDYVTNNKTLAKAAVEPVHNYTPFIDYRKFDMSSTAINAGGGVTSGDVIKLFNVAPNTYSTGIYFRNMRALHAGTSAEIGDTADADGYIGNDYTYVPYIDLDNAASTGVSIWRNVGPYHSGVSNLQFSGVSLYFSGPTQAPLYLRSNHGPYFTSGISPYIGKDTINMTIYVDKAVTPVTGVTPYFEMAIEGFKRVVP
jgi:hypothetical protein